MCKKTVLSSNFIHIALRVYTHRFTRRLKKSASDSFRDHNIDVKRHLVRKRSFLQPLAGMAGLEYFQFVLYNLLFWWYGNSTSI